MAQEQKKSVKGKFEKYYDGSEKPEVSDTFDMNTEEGKKGLRKFLSKTRRGKVETYYPEGKVKVEGPFDMNTEEGQRKAMESLLNSRKRGR